MDITEEKSGLVGLADFSKQVLNCSTSSYLSAMLQVHFLKLIILVSNTVLKTAALDNWLKCCSIQPCSKAHSNMFTCKYFCAKPCSKEQKIAPKSKTSLLKASLFSQRCTTQSSVSKKKRKKVQLKSVLDEKMLWEVSISLPLLCFALQSDKMLHKSSTKVNQT